MTTAKKLDYTFPILRAVSGLDKKAASKLNPLLVESRETFEMLGWAALPESIKLVIAIDIIGFRDELNGMYSTSNPGVLNRRKRINYWVDNYQQGVCSEESVIEALRVSYL